MTGNPPERSAPFLSFSASAVSGRRDDPFLCERRKKRGGLESGNRCTHGS